jgi:hypothetical protein
VSIREHTYLERGELFLMEQAIPHTPSAYVSIREHTCLERGEQFFMEQAIPHKPRRTLRRFRHSLHLHTSAYVSMRRFRQSPPAYVSIRQHAAFSTVSNCIRQHTSAYVSMRSFRHSLHLTASTCIRQHPSAYVSIRSFRHSLHLITTTTPSSIRATSVCGLKLLVYAALSF